MHSYAQAIDYLYGLRPRGMKLGLDSMRQLLRLCGEPQKRLRFIHIAGTNGKGSVAAMLASVLRQSGRRTALYTSPHLVSFCERFQINGKPIPPADLLRLVGEIRPHVENLSSSASAMHPTFFEVSTALAANYFAQQNAEIVVWETGLGGRLDATNVVEPLVCVITSIGFDHTQYLGNTLADIAREKAGIIKPNVPVVSNVAERQAAAEIRAVAAQRGAPLIFAGDSVCIERLCESVRGQTLRVRSRKRDYGQIHLPLVGDHQIENCQTVISVLETLCEADFPVTASHIRDGLARTHWPGRFQLVGENPPLLLDGAHNPQAAEKLRVLLERHFQGKPLSLLLGILRDKDCQHICRILAPLASTIFTVPVKNERTSDPESLAALCRTANPNATVRPMPTFAEALDAARLKTDATVVVTGSLFLVGEALQRLAADPPHARFSEKELTMQ